MIGGSAGFKMMIAFPLAAPPITSIPLLVVLVNSSILALVPGPALLLDTVATISPYETGTTSLIARTIGIVACPPHVIILTFASFICSFKFAAGETKGPIAAGVKSITILHLACNNSL